MADNGKRIIDIPQTSGIGAGDSFIIDSPTAGTTRTSYSEVAEAVKNTLGIENISQKADGAMQISVYDQNRSGVVDDSEKLEGKPASFFATASGLDDVSSDLQTESRRAALAEETISGSIGALSSLNTTEKDSLVGAVNELESGKVDKVNGKGLSTNDFTDSNKQVVSPFSIVNGRLCITYQY